MEHKVTPGNGKSLSKGRGEAQHFLVGLCVLGGLKYRGHRRQW